MNFEVLKLVRLKSYGSQVLRPGERIQADPEKARQYVEQGILRPVDEPDGFKSGFDFLYDRLTGPARKWESCGLAPEIKTGLERMDGAWVKRDLIGFQDCLAAIHRLLTRAGFPR